MLLQGLGRISAECLSEEPLYINSELHTGDELVNGLFSFSLFP